MFWQDKVVSKAANREESE